MKHGGDTNETFEKIGLQLVSSESNESEQCSQFETQKLNFSISTKAEAFYSNQDDQQHLFSKIFIFFYDIVHL